MLRLGKETSRFPDGEGELRVSLNPQVRAKNLFTNSK